MLGMYIFHWEFRKPVLEIHFFHLDRGRSIFIRTPHNKTILIDGGQNTQVLRELTKVMPFYRRRIDLIILTSSAAKNAGGLVDVVKRYEIGKIIEPAIMGTSTAMYVLDETVNKKNIKVQKLGKGDEFSVDNVNFKILFPDPDFKFNKTSLPEMVLLLTHASSSALLLGDVSKTIQKSLVSEVGKVNIVEYAHSASDSRVSTDLFNKLNPDYIVITKKETARAPSKTKKKFDIDQIEKSKIHNLEKEGTMYLNSI